MKTKWNVIFFASTFLLVSCGKVYSSMNEAKGACLKWSSDRALIRKYASVRPGINKYFSDYTKKCEFEIPSNQIVGLEIADKTLKYEDLGFVWHTSLPSELDYKTAIIFKYR